MVEWREVARSQLLHFPSPRAHAEKTGTAMGPKKRERLGHGGKVPHPNATLADY